MSSPALEIRNATLRVGHGDAAKRLLDNVSADFADGHFAAVLGPSGCGKTTLLKLVAGIAPGEEAATVLWRGRDLGEEDFSPSEIAYVPQFCIAHETLTVRESVDYAMRLRVRSDPDGRRERVDTVLGETGLAEHAASRVSVLSGGQQRRLSLAMELVSNPSLLLCDEVTSGLDPASEDDIVRLLHGLSRKGKRLVLSVTHSLAHLDLYDSVLVLYKGVTAYQGPPALLAHYFGVEDADQLYTRLAQREPADWAASWAKHRVALGEAASAIDPATPAGDEHDKVDAPDQPPESGDDGPGENGEPPPTPGVASQFLTLLSRRLRVFLRSQSGIGLQLGLVVGFPCLVAVFAWNGLPAVHNLSMGLDLNVVEQLREAREFLVHSSRVGSLVSGIVMFQVILLTLMGANNSGREIASERNILEKEKLAGLDPLAYVASKAAFLLGLVVVQSVWMGLFVHHVCGFPGELAPQLLFLLLVNAAMTSICLGISSLMRTAEQASLVSIYLVGFQLPLSGTVLALPELLGDVVRPFISAYWSWSGILQTLKDERYYDIVQTVVQSPLAPPALCLWILGAHIVAGLLTAWIGCERHRTG